MRPIDLYASRNVPEIFSLLETDYEDEDIQKAISFKGPLPLGDMETEAHRAHQINPIQLAGASRNIIDVRTGRILLYKVDSGWSDARTMTQIYDNKGNRATDAEADFQISKVRRKTVKKMYDVHFTDWRHLTPMEMS